MLHVFHAERARALALRVATLPRLVASAFFVSLVLSLPSLHAQGVLTYRGLEHSSVGAAQLQIDPTGSLLVSNIGSSGLDGVEVHPAGFAGGISVGTGLELAALPVGSSVTATAVGADGSGAPVDLAVAALTVVEPGECVLEGVGATSTRVYFGGQLVHEEPGSSFSFGIGLSGPLHWRAVRAGDETTLRVAVDCGVIRHRFGGTVIVGDAIEFSRVEPCLGLPEECATLTSLRLHASDLGSFTIRDETVMHLGAGFSGIGAVSLSAGVSPGGTAAVSVSNIGSSGLDGVSVRYPTLMSECSVGWTPPVPDDPALPGSTLTIGSRGIIAGSDSFLGSLSVTDVGGSLVCTPDYSPIDATSHRVEVYNAGSAVVSLPGLVTPFIEVAGPEFPRGCGKLDQWPLLCLWSEWESSRQFTIDGVTVVGDELRVIAEGSVEVVAISEISLCTIGISSLEITAAEGTAFVFPHRPPPVDIDIDTLTGSVVSRWLTSIAYKDISVTVTDDETQSVQVFPLPGTATEVDLGRLVANGRVVYKFCLGQDTTIQPAETFVLGHRLHSGLNHFAVGNAQLEEVGETLVVSNIGSSGLDGVSIAVSDFAGLDIATVCELPLMPEGSTATFRTKGETTLGDVVVVRQLDGIAFTPSDENGFPVTYTLRASLGDLTAFEVSGLSGETLVGLLLPAVQNLRYAPTWDGPSLVHTFHIEGGYVVGSGFDPDPDNLCVWDRLDFTVDSPLAIAPVTHVEITGAGFPFFALGKEKQKPNPPILAAPTTSGGTVPHRRARVVGTVTPAGTPAVSIHNLGSVGKDGVDVRFPPSSECSVGFDPIVSTPGIAGASLVVGASGAVAGESAFLGSVSLTDQGASLLVTPDYSPIGATSHRIEVYDQGVQVASFPGLVAPTIEVADNVFPPRCGKVDQWPLLCLWFEWSSQRTVSVDGAVFAGDELRVIAEGSVEVQAISALEFSTVGIPELLLTEMTNTLYSIPPVTDLAASINPADGHVIVSWTNPVPYRSADLVVGDSVLPLGSPAPTQVDLGPLTLDLTFIWLKLFFEKHCLVIVIDVPSLLSTGNPEFVRGDANADSAINIGDTIYLLGYLFSSGPAPGCLSSGDVNDDGAVNIGDPISLLSYLFSSGPAPAAPFPACGTDPTVDTLGCLDSPCTP